MHYHDQVNDSDIRAAKIVNAKADSRFSERDRRPTKLPLSTRRAFLKASAASSAILLIPRRTLAFAGRGGGNALNSVQSWEERSTASGVFMAYGFESASDVTNNYSAGPNGTLCFQDTSVACIPGGASMRFDLPAGYTGADIAGSWWGLTSGLFLPSSFGANSTFYIQYRYRLTQTMVSNLHYWNSDWKTSIIFQNQVSCASHGMEITCVQNYGEGPILYTACGNRAFYTYVDNPGWQAPGATPYLFQSSWDLSSGPNWKNEPNGIVSVYGWQGFPNSSGFQFPTESWNTIDIKVTIGGMYAPGTGTADSYLEAWIQPEGYGYRRKFVSINYTQYYDNSPTDAFNNIMLTPYMTNLSTSAPVDASVWYDELIGSTNPIALPGTPNT